MQADRRRGRDAQHDDGSSAPVRRRTGQRIADVPLVERHSEIDAIEDAIDRGGRADGQLLIVEGPSGIGKSRLLAAARIIAAQKGAEVLTTCGGELEREFPFGLVRRLLEARAVRAPQAERESLIRGHAALAGSLLGLSPAPDESPLADEFHLIHSLYWFVANLADESHLVLIADDLQWADDLSLRFLLYLAQRLADLQVTIIGAVRTGDPAAEAELVARLLLQADRSLRPAELTVAGVRKLFMTVLPDVAENATVVAESWTATGGNPFLLNQLATAMSAGAGEGKHDLAGRVADTAPESVGRSVMLRLSRLGEDAVDVARAVSVLGTSTSLIAAAELAGLDFAAASAAAGKLRAVQIFSDASDLTFYHPMIRSAVYNRYPADERAQAHLRAAELLRASDGEAERVAVHLMRGAPPPMTGRGRRCTRPLVTPAARGHRPRRPAICGGRCSFRSRIGERMPACSSTSALWRPPRGRKRPSRTWKRPSPLSMKRGSETGRRTRSGRPCSGTAVLLRLARSSAGARMPPLAIPTPRCDSRPGSWRPPPTWSVVHTRPTSG